MNLLAYWGNDSFCTTHLEVSGRDVDMGQHYLLGELSLIIFYCTVSPLVLTAGSDRSSGIEQTKILIAIHHLSRFKNQPPAKYHRRV